MAKSTKKLGEDGLTLQNELREAGGAFKRILLPAGITYQIDSWTDKKEKKELRKIYIILDGKDYSESKKSYGISGNMQEDGSAFEAWAFLLHEHLENVKEIILSVDSFDALKKNEENVKDENGKKDIDTRYLPKDGKNKNNGHINRFLYRVIKFKESYGNWFTVEKNLDTYVENFRTFLKTNNFCNNYSHSKESKSDGGKAEHYIESIFCKGCDQELLIKMGIKKLYNQLPVGLFKLEDGSNNYEERNRIFTGGRSAIDLWSIDDNTLIIYELKFNNKKLGIITELMFYANYLTDLFSGMFRMANANQGKSNKAQNKRIKEYNELFDAKISKIKAVMLIDKCSCHPALTSKIIKALNNPATKINSSVKTEFVKTLYKVNVSIPDIKS